MAGGSLVKEKPKVLASKNSRNCFYSPAFVKIIHTLVHTFRGIFTVKLSGVTTALDFFSRQGDSASNTGLLRGGSRMEKFKQKDSGSSKRLLENRYKGAR